MRVLLIYSPVTIYGPGSVGAHMPLGLAYLAAYLEKYHYHVKILDALALGKNIIKKKGKSTRIGLPNAQIKQEIADFQPDVVGISIMFTAFAADAFNVAKLAKQVNKKIVTVFGGAHVSIDPAAIVKNKYADIAVRGEGEVTFLNLIKALKSKKSLTKVTGITYKKGKKVTQNPPTPMIKNLDDLPLPARHLLPVHLYFGSPGGFALRYPQLGIVSSRGCPAHCVYCSIHSLWSHTWRGRSAAKVVDEIQHLIFHYGIKEFSFLDDSASLNKKRMNQICDEIIKRKLDVKWTTPNGIAHWTLDKPLLAKMKRAGCYRITFGIESGNEQVRRWVGKPYSLKQAKELTQYANKIGMWTLATNIIGFPYETRAEIKDTINYAIASDVDMAFFFRLGPRPGTPVYEVFKKEGWLPKDERKLFSESVACDTKHIKGKELYNIQNHAYKKFFYRRFLSFLNPARIIHKIHSFEDFLYLARMTGDGLKMAANLMATKTGVTSKAIKTV